MPLLLIAYIDTKNGMENMGDAIAVQMRLRQTTIQKVEKLSKVFRSKNRADTVKTSIDIADFIIEAITKGSQVFLCPPWYKFWQKTQRIIIPPLNH